MSLRRGITTGTCAAAAAKAAATVLVGHEPPREVELRLPGGDRVRVPIVAIVSARERAAVTASVRKDAGDDPDVTDGMEIRATVSWNDSPDVQFAAGEGVGTVTKPGLQIPPGQPAINPVPRQMIANAVHEVTDRGVRVEIAIPGGREVAAETFNPRLGIEGGLSILGTTGVVRPYCIAALRDALKCTLDVAAACGVKAPVLVPGNIGARAARRHFALSEEQVIEAGNEWGYLVDLLSGYALEAVLVVGHPGKLAKLAAGQWDTHSGRSRPAVEYLAELYAEVLGSPGPDRPTAEGMFSSIEAEQRESLGRELARRVRAAVDTRLAGRLPTSVFLIDMAGNRLGSDGDLSLWQ